MVMYEMMVGRPPFEGKDEAEQFERILTADLKFPARIPDFAKNFLSGLLKKNPTQRSVLSIIEKPYFLLGMSVYFSVFKFDGCSFKVSE